MSDLLDAIARTQGEHAAALKWFLSNTNKTVSWAEIKDHSNVGPRLVTQAKGIYKPHYTDYALSVRQTIDSPYADKEIERRSDGSWIYPYYQENPNPAERDKEATNRGLIKCMTDRIPVGVLLQTKPKPGVEYQVLGLAVVSEWLDGYFILEGFSDVGQFNIKEKKDAARDRSKINALISSNEDFDLSTITDMRQKQLAQVVRRKGQVKFRAILLTAYSGKCAVTGCDAVEALEAAHITPYQGDHTDHPQNGLLLRADIHSLFDLGLLSVEPSTLTVVLSPKLRATSYGALEGRKLLMPDNLSLRPSHSALSQHLKWCGI